MTDLAHLRRAITVAVARVSDWKKKASVGTAVDRMVLPLVAKDCCTLFPGKPQPLQTKMRVGLG